MVRSQFKDIKGGSELAMLAAPTAEELKQLQKAVAIMTPAEKNTAAKFGSFIHKYPMRQAVEDGTVVPLLYEGRLAELEANQAQLDRWFERHTQGLTDEQKADLKRKMSSVGVLSDADRRIQEISYNLSEHFARNFKGRYTGFKAQLATSSKRMALRYKQHLDF